MNNSISAGQRWAESHYIRTCIIFHVWDDLGMVVNQDVAKNLKASQLGKNSKGLNKIMTSIEGTLNLFSATIEKNSLCNIASEKAALKNTEEFLIKAEDTGKEMQEKFITK